jgi:hypothetical protein
MALVARIRRLSLVLASVGALVAPALAGDHMAPGCPDETSAKSRSLPCTDCMSPAARAPRTSVNPSDDVYTPKSKPSAAHPADVGPAPGANHTPVSDAPAREHKREHATAIARAPRPAPQRVRVSIRNLPATPGMGTLLRVGVTAGREISWLEFNVPFAPTSSHSGRAPPPGSTPANLAPAALPGAPPIAAPLRACPLTRGTAPPQHPTPKDALFANALGQGPDHVLATRLAASPIPGTTERHTRARSGAERPESAPSRDSSRLS